MVFWCLLFDLVTRGYYFSLFCLSWLCCFCVVGVLWFVVLDGCFVASLVCWLVRWVVCFVSFACWVLVICVLVICKFVFIVFYWFYSFCWVFIVLH